MSRLRRDPYLQVVWTDPVTGRRGYLVIDRLGRGVASGGLRMREGVTLDEVADLAHGMTLKEAVAYRPHGRYVPVGGGKGGIDCDPRSPEAEGMLGRFMLAMRPYLREMWVTGEDLGVRQEQVDEAARAAGLRSTIDAFFPLLQDEAADLARLAEAFTVKDDGVGLDELVGGCGVAEAALTVVQRAGLEPAAATAVVQGFGSIGGATARFLARAGVRVVGVVDVDGLVANAAGLDVEALLAARDGMGCIDRAALRPADEVRPREEWLDVPCDVLVPAAVSYCIDEHHAGRVRARWVVEGANVPVTSEAEAVLAARGITVVPDFVANSSTNSWWWWVLSGDCGADAASSYTLIRGTMRAMVTSMFDLAEQQGLSPRQAAHGMAEFNLEAIARRSREHR